MSEAGLHTVSVSMRAQAEKSIRTRSKRPPFEGAGERVIFKRFA